MRRVCLLIFLPLVLVGCLGTQPYESIDITQVKEAYATLTPLLEHFQTVYEENNWPEMQIDYTKEQEDCKLVDKIDARDTIDASTNLWVASSHLDSYCNDIETAYNLYRRDHGMPWNQELPPAYPGAYFVDGDYNIFDFKILMRNPGATWRPGTPFPLTWTPGPTPNAKQLKETATAEAEYAATATAVIQTPGPDQAATP